MTTFPQNQTIWVDFIMTTIMVTAGNGAFMAPLAIRILYTSNTYPCITNQVRLAGMSRITLNARASGRGAITEFRAGAVASNDASAGAATGATAGIGSYTSIHARA